VTSVNDGEVFTHHQDHEELGEMVVPTHFNATEIEAAAMAKYGSYVGDQGMPAFAEFVEPDHWGNLVGRVAVALVTWPANSPFG
jgi:hypothetical protein